jgi:glutathione S-transferase
MWNRRLVLDGFLPLIHSLRNKTSFFIGKVIPGTRNEIKQLPELVQRGIEMFEILLNRIDPHLLNNQFISGNKFSVADITGHFMMNLSKILKIEFKNDYPNAYRWQNELSTRQSVNIN